MGRFVENVTAVCNVLSCELWLAAGTHNSFTFHLDKSGAIAPGASDAVHGLVNLFGVLAKKIVSNWSKTQSVKIDAQLKAGVRYFDIRVSSRPDSSELFVVHGFYGPSVESCLDTLAAFLDEHSHEVVLLDFNHFYDIDAAAHDRLIKALIDRLVPVILLWFFLTKMKTADNETFVNGNYKKITYGLENRRQLLAYVK